MREYRIAFFTVDWNYELVESTLQGIKRFVDAHENVQLRVFDCFGKDVDSPRDRSEYAIFNLADLSQFDGVLIQGNQIVLEPIREQIARRVKEAGIPAVSIDCPMEGCTLVGIDNRRAQYELTRHLIDDHGARRMVYLTGILDNGCPEAQQRRDGFLDACREAGLDESGVELVTGAWRTSDGTELVMRRMKAGKPLPDAFVCANDDMALGVVEALTERGVRIPGDVIVTGFDGLNSAELSSPRLTTVHRDAGLLDYLGLEVLLGKIEGRETRDFVPFEHSVVCSQSCGCRDVARLEAIREQYFRQIRTLKHFYNHQDQMAEELFDAADLASLMDIVEQNREIFGCDNVYVCINDYYFDNYEKKRWNQDSEAFGREMVLAACSREDFTRDERHQYERFATSRLLPERLMSEERFLIFYPLHYNTYSIGYLVMDSISSTAKLNLHKSIFNFLEIAIENVRKKGLLRQMNVVLDALYVQDGMTGLFNRSGFARYGQERFDAFMRRDGGAQVLFIDMDNMKHINDVLGHEYGDTAIKATAQIIRDNCGPDDFIMRYGGDEFLVIASGRSRDLDARIERSVAARNAAGDLTFQLSLSVGAYFAEAGEGLTLDECVRAADAKMYEIKSSHHSRA